MTVGTNGPIITTVAVLGIIALILVIGLLFFCFYYLGKEKYNRSRLNSATNSSSIHLGRLNSGTTSRTSVTSVHSPVRCDIGIQTPPPRPNQPKKVVRSQSPSNASFDSTLAVVNQTVISDRNNDFRPIGSPKMVSLKSSPPPLLAPGRSLGRSRLQIRRPIGSEENPITYRNRVGGHGRATEKS